MGYTWNELLDANMKGYKALMEDGLIAEDEVPTREDLEYSFSLKQLQDDLDNFRFCYPRLLL